MTHFLTAFALLVTVANCIVFVDTVLLRRKLTKECADIEKVRVRIDKMTDEATKMLRHAAGLSSTFPGPLAAALASLDPAQRVN